MSTVVSEVRPANDQTRTNRRHFVDPIGRLLRLEDVCANVGLSKTKIYRSIKK